MNLDSSLFVVKQEYKVKATQTQYCLRFINIMSMLVQVFVSMRILREVDHSEMVLIHVLAILWSLIYHVSPPYRKSPLFLNCAYVICAVSFCTVCLNSMEASYSPDNFVQLIIIVLTFVLMLPPVITSFTLILLIFYENEKPEPKMVLIPTDTFVTKIVYDQHDSQVNNI
ncbi:unnamed protein product [Moneuplotes crassus]|uniref:Uncharacterized protein n=1 Tax=Euplotes crassus TaxID=5936 RepID=A0AAD2D6L1_EUPCR|nr:unnamed protein product [Moneuplotes crassus]